MTKDIEKKLTEFESSLKNNNIQVTRIVNAMERLVHKKISEIESTVFELNERLVFYFNKLDEYKKDNVSIKEDIKTINENINNSNSTIRDLISKNSDFNNKDREYIKNTLKDTNSFLLFLEEKVDSTISKVDTLIENEKDNIKNVAKINNLSLRSIERIEKLEKDRNSLIVVSESLDNCFNSLDDTVTELSDKVNDDNDLLRSQVLEIKEQIENLIASNFRKHSIMISDLRKKIEPLEDTSDE